MLNLRCVGRIISSAAILIVTLYMSGTPALATASQTLFTTQTPSSIGQSDGARMNYELGTMLQSNTAGQITAIRFSKDGNESGTHTGHNAGTLVLNASSSTLNFGNVALSSSGSQNVTLTNAGTSSVTISNVSISGAGFSASGVPAGLILSAGQTATLTVTFAPAATGRVTGSVTITSNATNSPATVTLSGTGVTAVMHSASLSWIASTSTVIGYNCYSSAVSGGPYVKLNALPIATTSYTDLTVQSGTTYYYVVTSVDSNNVESAFSSQVSATIP